MSLTGKALIVQNKGGGHGSIGYHLCKQLITNNPELKVTILQDKVTLAKYCYYVCLCISCIVLAITSHSRVHYVLLHLHYIILDEVIVTTNFFYWLLFPC